MTVFSSDSLDKIPQNGISANSPVRFLECAIYACLLSHCQEIDTSIIPEMAIRISGGEIRLICPKQWGALIIEKAKECFVLKNLKFPWIVSISDEEFENLKNRR